jgi:membrane protein DedA with SNARE-associated domain
MLADLSSYTILYVCVAASWIGVPLAGGVAMAGAVVLAAEGDLNLWLVILDSAAASWMGGLVGYSLGARWAPLAEQAGRWQDHRRRAMSAGRRFYRRWGSVAVFLTPTWVSGALDMPRRPFLAWNAVAAIISTLTGVFGVWAVAGVVVGRLSGWHDVIAAGGAAALVAAALALTVREQRRRRALRQRDARRDERRASA